MTKLLAAETKKCPRCSYHIEDLYSMRCPRCYQTLLQACSCHGNCSHCGESRGLSKEKCKTE